MNQHPFGIPAILALACLAAPLRAETYSPAVLADSPVAYFPLGNALPENTGRVVAVNQGSLGTLADALHFPGVAHQVPGALVAGGDTAMRFNAIDKTSNDGNYATRIPYVSELHPETFSWEGWVRPTVEGRPNAQCVFMNYTSSGDRIGWVLWQRASRTGTPGGDGSGWNLRMYKAVGGDRLIDIVTGTGAGGYNVGEWQHLAFTYNQGTKTAFFYVNGVQVGTQVASSGSYVPNPGTVDPAIGGFPDSRQNPFEGDIDEVAIYDKVLSSTLIAQHHANGTNPSPLQAYPALIASDGPIAYYRMNEAALGVVTNQGTAGAVANGVLVNAPDSVDGPMPPGYKGFDAGKKASEFRGSQSYVELNNPAPLNFSGPITLEAWIQPAAAQSNFASCILAHGANSEFSSELFLRIENGNYEVGSASGGASGKASAPIPAGDAGSTAWIHLAGTWNAGTWTLYRNGSVLATGAGTNGAPLINDANWAIGARGRWDNEGNFPAAVAGGNQRVFNGRISNAAIYASALSADRIKSHFFSGIGSEPLTVTSVGSTVTLTWSSGVLQQSDTLDGWEDVPGAVSPYQPADGPRHFYRLRY